MYIYSIRSFLIQVLFMHLHLATCIFNQMSNTIAPVNGFESCKSSHCTGKDHNLIGAMVLYPILTPQARSRFINFLFLMQTSPCITLRFDNVLPLSRLEGRNNQSATHDLLLGWGVYVVRNRLMDRLADHAPMP